MKRHLDVTKPKPEPKPKCHECGETADVTITGTPPGGKEVSFDYCHAHGAEVREVMLDNGWQKVRTEILR